MVGNKSAERQLHKSRGLRSTSRGITDWSEANSELVVYAIERASFTGGALRLGYSRDGGAYAIGIYGDGDPYTVYLPAGGDMDAWLNDIISLYESIADDQAVARRSPKNGSGDDLPV